jgi:ketosteroid isomerase-like protein
LHQWPRIDGVDTASFRGFQSYLQRSGRVSRVLMAGILIGDFCNAGRLSIVCAIPPTRDTDMPDANLKDHLLLLESERRRALVEEDHSRVAQLFAEDLVYVHTTGLVQGKADYLDYAQSAVQYLAIERGELQVRFYGEHLAVMTGPQCNTLCKRGGDQPIRGEGFATQVWALGSEGWQISSFHATRAPS